MNQFEISRRRFLQFSGASIGASAVTLSLSDIAEAALRQPPLPRSTPILVVVTLYGGNDGLNTVVPYTDPLYSALRPGLSYTPSQVLPLANGLGLNPAMKAMHDLWNKKQLAVVLGTGYPNPNHSHFSSMAIWQSASPQTSVSTGWLGRWLDTLPHNPLKAIAIGSVLPPLLAGAHQVGSVLPQGGLSIPTGDFGAKLQSLATPSSNDSLFASEAATSISDLYSVGATVQPVLAQAGASSGNPLKDQLSTVASLIGASVPTQVYAVSMTGFDTHANELGAQSTLLGQFSDAVGSFMTSLGQLKNAPNVTLMAYSEFGRRAAANGSAGTDHGTAGPVFVVGNKVAGGLYGEQPPLNALVDGDLAVTQDFRSIYASLLTSVLKADPTAVLNGWNTTLPFLTF